MAHLYDAILKGGAVVNEDGQEVRDIGIGDGRIAAIGDLDRNKAREVIDCRGLHVLPGVIDTHVHFREPGLEHKEDFETGSAAAVLGGVTAVLEMPNSVPATTTQSALEDKIARARGRMHCDFAFYIGASPDNVDELPRLERLPGAAGIKVFMGSSTGSLLVEDDATIRRILEGIRRRASFHCEDEEELRRRMHLRVEGDVCSHPLWRDEATALTATERLVRLAHETGRRVHVLHVSTAQELEFLARHKDVASVETTVNHLSLQAPECYRRFGTLAQMNPPVRDASHRAAIWHGLGQGIVDVIGSDHAPHTREEKAMPYPASPSGMPGVQTLLPVMLDHVNAGRLTLPRLVDLTSAGPARLFGIARKGRIAVGYDADLTVIDLKRRNTIDDRWIASRAAWTPYHGMAVTGWPVGTLGRGRRVMWDGELVTAASGAPLRFLETLLPEPPQNVDVS
jgi:dihydroorotase